MALAGVWRFARPLLRRTSGWAPSPDRLEMAREAVRPLFGNGSGMVRGSCGASPAAAVNQSPGRAAADGVMTAAMMDLHSPRGDNNVRPAAPAQTDRSGPEYLHTHCSGDRRDGESRDLKRELFAVN